MSAGASAAGIRLHTAVEVRQDTCQAYALNHRGVTVINADIRTVGDIRVDRGDEELVVFGGPPCQGFSTSNQRTRRVTNPGNWLFVEFIRIIRQLAPDWIVFENVAGILQTDSGSFVRRLKADLGALGFRLSSGLLDAAAFGVPQRRSRYFVVGWRHGEPCALETGGAQAAPVTVADALADLPPLNNGASTDVLPYGSPANSRYAKLMRGGMRQCSGHLVTRNADSIVERYTHIPQGGNWRDIPAVMMATYADRSRCHTGIFRRLSAGDPATVIGNFRKNMLVHPFEDRGLSIREAARLQSFPDSYLFRGSIGIQQQQVGNAVPPLLAEAVFAKIARLSQPTVAP